MRPAIIPVLLQSLAKTPTDVQERSLPVSSLPKAKAEQGVQFPRPGPVPLS